MPRTVVGLFRSQSAVDRAVREIERLGFGRNEVRVVGEPDTFEVTGVMSFPRLDFESKLDRGLRQIGASEAEAQTYLEGLRNGAIVLFATDPDEQKVQAAADIMNRHCALEVEEGAGPEPYLPRVEREGRTSHDTSDYAGRVAQGPQPGNGYFSW
ncbi:MAG: hypothetical protein ACRD3D_11525 [Terriglobia bacterium]